MSRKLYVAADANGHWENIDFSKAEKSVKKLQKRIAEACISCNLNLLSILQHKMIHSFYAKALAVKIVTSKRGAKTPGVDGQIYPTTEDKYRLISELRFRGYNPLPLKRIYIAKSNGKFRPIGIPTIKDRAMQTLIRFAIEPIAEITADNCSYAYRRNRSAKDAVASCIDILSKNENLRYVLKTDIKSCFDNIIREWILEHTPFDKNLLSKCLNYKYVDRYGLHICDNGIPQGGCLSPMLFNMAIDGLEDTLRKSNVDNYHIVRYADDLIVFASALPRSALPIVKEFLAKRKLSLSEDKTYLNSLDKGFSFLGFKIAKNTNSISVVPNEEKAKSFINKVSVILKGDYKYSWLYLKGLILGWLNYYYGVSDTMNLLAILSVIMRIFNDTLASSADEMKLKNIIIKFYRERRKQRND